MDFYVSYEEHSNNGETITVTTAKQSVRDNEGVTLDNFLAKLGVPDQAIGEAIEKLEGLPNGLAQVTVQGRNSKIVINQSW